MTVSSLSYLEAARHYLEAAPEPLKEMRRIVTGLVVEDQASKEAGKTSRLGREYGA